MIAFGSPVTNREVYDRCAAPGIRDAAEPDSLILDGPAPGTIYRSYNAVLDQAAAREDLEALVLLHQDTEIVDGEGFCAEVRRTLADPTVGVAGCVGAVGVRGIAWWEGSVTCASFIHRYPEHGGGDLPAFSWSWAEAPPYARLGDVETLDGFLLVLSPWVVRNIRFDESLGTLHGYDLDFCLQVREAGLRAVTAGFRAIHNHSLDLVSAPDEWVEAHVRVADKWAGRMPGIGSGPGTWRERARQAEAERDAAWALAHSNASRSRARVAELEHALAEVRGSISWRITAPLRRATRARRQQRTLSPVRPVAGADSP